MRSPFSKYQKQGRCKEKNDAPLQKIVVPNTAWEREISVSLFHLKALYHSNINNCKGKDVTYRDNVRNMLKYVDI